MAIDTTEANTQNKFYDPGKISNLYLYLSANTSANSTVLYVRVNGSNTAVTFTVSGGATGYFEDTTNKVDVVANDLLSIFFDRGAAGTITAQLMGCYLDPGSNVCYPLIAVTGGLNFSAASTTTSTPISGFLRNGSDNISNRVPILASYTLRNLHTYVSANTRTTSTTFKLRKTAADAGPLITIGASSTGLFEDTSNTASFVATDQMSYYVVTGTGAGTITFNRSSIVLDSTTQTYQVILIELTGRLLTSLSPVYIPISGSHTTSATEAQTSVKLRGTGTFSNFNGYISTNTATATTTYTVRKNNAATSVSFTVSAAATGQFSDTSNSFGYADGDLINYEYSKPSGTGGPTHRWFTSLISSNTDFTPKVRYY
jgi:hypothetical protein